MWRRQLFKYLLELGEVIQMKSLTVYSLGAPSGSTITGLITVSLVPISVVIVDPRGHTDA